MLSTNANVVLSHPTIRGMDADLSAMWLRLTELLLCRPFEAGHFVEVAAIFNNAAYVFLYLDSNSAHIASDSLQPWKKAFFDDDVLDLQLLGILSQVSFTEAELESSRAAYLEHLIDKQRVSSSPSNEAIADGLSRAKGIVASITTDVLDLLKRLNVTTATARPEAAFYALVNRTRSATARRKLYSAWRHVRDKRLDSLIATIDEVVQARWNDARCHGFQTVAQGTFEKCGVSTSEAEEFLNDHLTRAVECQAQLCRMTGGTRGPRGVSLDEFGYYLTRRHSADAAPMLDLEACLRFAFDVGRATLGLGFERIDSGTGDRIQVDVFDRSRFAGRIHFDLWTQRDSPKTANFTRGLRNRTSWNSVEQVPVAHVSCRFRRADDGRDVLHFQNVHSLFHEFGHALNHLFIKRRMPNQSGLEYLPLERLEILSMWFEKWIYHPDFASYLRAGGTDPAHLAAAQEVKRLEYRRTHLDRAVIAAIDLMVHEYANLSVKEAYRLLDTRFAIGDFCDLGAILPGFTWPMMQSNPSAYFAYVWGAAKSAEMFAPFMDSCLADLPDVCKTWSTLAECFEFEHPSAPPRVDSVFEFYGG